MDSNIGKIPTYNSLIINRTIMGVPNKLFYLIWVLTVAIYLLLIPTILMITVGILATLMVKFYNLQDPRFLYVYMDILTKREKKRYSSI